MSLFKRKPKYITLRLIGPREDMSINIPKGGARLSDYVERELLEAAVS